MDSYNNINPDYLFMIDQAVKAPSGHNTQPWLFEIKDQTIIICPDLRRALSAVDPHYRELYISLGCAIENLVLAASEKGYETNIKTSKDGVTQIDLVKNDQVVTESLFAQIVVRQTNRSVYDGKKISKEIINEITTKLGGTGVNVYFFSNGTKEFREIRSHVIEGNRIQMSDESFKKELKSWMRFNRRHQDATNDGLSYAVFGAPNLPRFIVKPIISAFVNEKRQNREDCVKIDSSSHFVLLTLDINEPYTWVRLGRWLQRLLLKLTELNIAHAYMNQPNEVDKLASGLKHILQIEGEYPVILLRIGYGDRMPYSKRRAIEDVIVQL